MYCGVQGSIEWSHLCTLNLSTQAVTFAFLDLNVSNRKGCDSKISLLYIIFSADKKIFAVQEVQEEVSDTICISPTSDAKTMCKV